MQNSFLGCQVTKINSVFTGKSSKKPINLKIEVKSFDRRVNYTLRNGISHILLLIQIKKCISRDYFFEINTHLIFYNILIV